MEAFHESLLRPVFERLDARSRTILLAACKDWREVARRPELWRALDLPECEQAHKLDFAGLVALLERAKGGIVRLNLASSADALELQEQQRFELGLKSTDTLPYTRGLRAHCLAALCSNLQELVLDERISCIGGMTDDLAKALSTSCSQLRSLEVRFACYSLPSELFTDAGMATIAEGCPGLRSLTLVHCCCVTDRSLYAVAAYCTGLQQLKLVGYNERITDLGVAVLLESCHKLLSVDFCPKLNRVTDQSAAALARHCPALRAAHLSSGVTVEGVRALAAGCNQLQQLGLGRCSGLESRTTRDLICQCPALSWLRLPEHMGLSEAEVGELAALGYRVQVKRETGFADLAVTRGVPAPVVVAAEAAPAAHVPAGLAAAGQGGALLVALDATLH